MADQFPYIRDPGFRPVFDLDQFTMEWHALVDNPFFAFITTKEIQYNQWESVDDIANSSLLVPLGNKMEREVMNCFDKYMVVTTSLYPKGQSPKSAFRDGRWQILLSFLEGRRFIWLQNANTEGEAKSWAEFYDLMRANLRIFLEAETQKAQTLRTHINMDVVTNISTIIGNCHQ